MLVKMSPIKFRQAMRVARKMRRHPIQNHAQPLRMAAIHEIFEIIWLAVTASGREIPNGLVAPRSIKWVLRNRHKFEMGEAQSLCVGHQSFSQFAVRQP